MKRIYPHIDIFIQKLIDSGEEFEIVTGKNGKIKEIVSESFDKKKFRKIKKK